MKFLKRLRSFFLNPDTWIWLVPVLLVVPNIALAFTEYNDIIDRLSNIFLPLGVYCLIVSLGKRIGVTIWCLFPLMILCAFQVVLLYLYGESIIAIDMFMNVVTTSVSEASELLGNLRIAIVTVCLLYLPPLSVGVYLIVKRRYATSPVMGFVRRGGLFITGIGIVLFVVALCINERFRPSREIFPYNVISNLVTAVVRTGESLDYHETSCTFSYSPQLTRDPDSTEIYVLILGETSRADNWQLFGYNRPTNPRLSRRNDIVPFGYVLSEINTTHKSVPMLLSHLHSATFGDSVASTRSIFSAYNDSGYRTVFLSNQRRNHSYIDYYGEEAAESKFLTDDGEVKSDLALLDELGNILEHPTHNKVFIVLHTYGSHFEYRKRYTRDMAVFTPDNNSEASRLNRKRLINAYDNTIVMTDALIDSVISMVAERDAVSAVMYVSDHGEDIFDDDRERFLHSSPVATYYQLHVPMVVWTSSKFANQYPDRVSALNANSSKPVSSSLSVFHTLLDLSGIRTDYYDGTASLASPDYTPRPFKYLNDYNESVPLAESGLRPLDFDAMRKNGFTVGH